MSEITTETTPTVQHKMFRPNVDIVENEAGLMLYADMPGVSAETIDVTLNKNELTIHGKADARQKQYQRAFTLSKDVDRAQISAEVSEGVLTLTLPKLEEVEPTVRQIEVKTA